jgi:hypothetical protein
MGIFSQLSFLRGMSRVVNLFGHSRADRYLASSDGDAMYSDWKAIGNDLKQEIERYERKRYPQAG